MLTLMPAGAQPSDLWGNPTSMFHSNPCRNRTSLGRRCGHRAAFTGYRTSSSAALSLRARATKHPSSSKAGSAIQPAGLSDALRARPSAPQRQCMGPLTRPGFEGSCFALAKKPLRPTPAAPLSAPRSAPAPGADSAPSRPRTRRHPGGPAAKSRGLRSSVAHTFARSWRATAPTHGTWLASQGA